MEKLYFLKDKSKSIGPLTKLELARKVKYKSDLIWMEGYENWVAITEVPEFHDLVLSLPERKNWNVDFLQKFYSRINKRYLYAFILTGIITTSMATVVSVNLQNKKREAHIIELKRDFKNQFYSNRRKVMEKGIAKIRRNRNLSVKNLMVDLKNKRWSLQNDLQYAIERLNQAKEFHFLRTREERAREVANASQNILYLESEIEEIDEKINKLKNNVK